MAALPTISQTIDIGDVSVYLSGNDEALGALYGKRLNSPFTPVQLAIATDALRWRYEGDPTDSTLRGTANYANWMYGGYGLQAQNTILGGGGGVVLPVSGSGYVYYSLSDIIGAGGNDSPTYQNDILIGGTQLTYMIVGNVVETIQEGQFSFNSVSGTITRVNHFYTGDIIIIPFNRLA